MLTSVCLKCGVGMAVLGHAKLGDEAGGGVFG